MACCLWAVACGEPFTNAIFEEDVAFLAAIPHTYELRISGPASDSTGGTVSQALATERSELYELTRRTALGIDHGVLRLLRDIDRIVDAPPTERDADRRVWGPFRHPLDPVESRFVMDRGAGDRFVYRLEQRVAEGGELKADDEPYTAVISGDYESTGSVRHGTGTLTFDFDASARLTGGATQGRVEVDYEQRAEELSLTVRLFGFVDQAGAEPIDAAYAFVRSVDGVGDFEFAFVGESGERIEIRSRWRPTGTGRADGRVVWVNGPQTVTLVVTECWDELFVPTYISPIPNDREGSGDPEACAFEKQALPARISVPDLPEPG